MERIAPDDVRVAHPIGGDVAPTILRTMITHNVMLARSLVFTGDMATLSDAAIDAMKNPKVLEVAQDSRAQPGAPTGSGETMVRAIGEKGLLVAMTNTSRTPGPVNVPIAELNLAGDDSIPATDLWTGDKITSRNGYLSVDLIDGDSALLTIG